MQNSSNPGAAGYRLQLVPAGGAADAGAAWQLRLEHDTVTEIKGLLLYAERATNLSVGSFTGFPVGFQVSNVCPTDTTITHRDNTQKPLPLLFTYVAPPAFANYTLRFRAVVVGSAASDWHVLDALEVTAIGNGGVAVGGDDDDGVSGGGDGGDGGAASAASFGVGAWAVPLAARVATARPSLPPRNETACPRVDADTIDFASLYAADKEMVVVERGKRAVINASTPLLGTVIVHGELFVSFEPTAPALIFINAHEIRVQPGGALRVGNEGCRLPARRKVEIVLYGIKPPLTELPSNPGTKVLFVESDGLLSLHGAQRAPTWARLAATASVGAKSVKVDTPMEVYPGDTLVVTSTDFIPSQSKYVKTASERRRVVRRVSATEFELDAPLANEHWGEQWKAPAGSEFNDMVETRGEVMVLNRNIVIRGFVDDDPALSNYGGNTSRQLGWGGHCFFHMATIQLDSVELYDVGQRGHLARYVRIAAIVPACRCV